MRIKEDFEVIKEQIGIETIADHLLEKDGRLYKFPGERTGSIHIYEGSRSFYDFGRCVGGDVIKLWSHIRGCDNWTALQEIRETFGLSAPDKANSWKLIRQQEQARRQQIEAEKDAKRQWIKDVDALKAEAELLSGILSSGHCEPLSWLWCVCQNRLTTVNIQLDLLCGV